MTYRQVLQTQIFQLDLCDLQKLIHLIQICGLTRPVFKPELTTQIKVLKMSACMYVPVHVLRETYVVI